MILKCVKNPNSSFFNGKKKGFSFLEVMLSVFIFSLMMTTVSITFANLFKNYTKAKAIQINLENSQFAMNSMAKSLRTSSVLPSTDSTIKFFNYSDNKCTAYQHDEEDASLQIASVLIPIDDPLIQTGEQKIEACNGETLSVFSDVISSNVSDVKFDYIPSSEGSENIIGKVTISVEVCPTAGCIGPAEDNVRIQSSVSLRDYTSAGM
jgi:type II secretory pathway pseudopilin PulG